MTWTPIIKQHKPKIEARNHPIVMSAIAAVRLNPPFLAVIVRPHLMGEEMPWWNVGQHVDVAIGSGSDRGGIQITPGSMYRLATPGHRPKFPSAILRFVVRDWPYLQKVEPTIADYCLFGNRLEVVMPDEIARQMKGDAA